MNLPPLPEPPAHGSVRLPLRMVPRETAWSRVHRLGYDPVHFDRSCDGRFNAPDGSYGTLYVAETPSGALAESVLRARNGVPPLVARRQLEVRGLVHLRWPAATRLVDLTGPGLVSLGLDNRIACGADYGPAQRWSRWMWSHPEAPCGILYRSRNDPSQACAALFSDRVSSSPSVRSVATPLVATDFSPVVWEALQKYGAEVL